jgi:hypothetical protein
MKLLRTQRNQIFDLVSAEGLSPAQFYLHERAFTGDVKLSMKGTKFYFIFSPEERNQSLFIGMISYSPGQEIKSASTSTKIRWQALLELIKVWLKTIDRETAEPDKWEQMFESSRNIGFDSESDDNSQFNFTEVLQIQGAASRAKLSFESLDLDAERLKILNKKLDYIVEKAKNLGRFDWKNLFIGTMISTLIQISVSQETGKLVWNLLREAFKTVFLIALK